MDEELAAYRAKKQEQLNRINLNKSQILKEKEVSTELVSFSDPSGSRSSSSGSEDRHQAPVRTSSSSIERFVSKYDVYLYWTSLVLKYLLWISLMVLAVKLEFGQVFFILTLFYLIAVNLRKTPKQKGELSAYSVFNPNFEQLDGTLTAEQFERELVYGAVSMRG